MSDELQKQLAALLESLMGTASDGAMWAKGEIPLLVQEKIVYGRVTTALDLVVCAGLFRFALWFALKQYRRAMRSYDDKDRYRSDIFPERPGGLLSIGASILACVSFVGTIVNIEALALVCFAPRLYIIEWLRGMVTK